MSAPSSLASIPLCVPNIAGNEWEYVKECLDTGWVSTAGPFVEKFEREFAKVLGAKQAASTMNGTAALHIALLVCGVKPGDLVLISTETFIAPVNAISYCFAEPLFVDAEPHTWQMNPAEVVRILTEDCTATERGVIHNPTGKRVGAVMPVHILGHPVDLGPILTLCNELHIPVIEDATESLGGFYKGHACGTIGTVGCFSFNGNKLITTGGGGMLISNNEELVQHARHLSTTAKIEPVEFIHDEVGYNYRMTNLQAALGAAQLELLPQFLKRKREIFDAYNRAFADLPGVEPMPEADYAKSACWLYTARFPAGSRPLLTHLAERKIQTRPLWQPIHISPAYAHLPRQSCPVAEDLNRTCLSLPCSTNLTDEQLDRTISTISEYLRQTSIS